MPSFYSIAFIVQFSEFDFQEVTRRLRRAMKSLLKAKAAWVDIIRAKF